MNSIDMEASTDVWLWTCRLDHAPEAELFVCEAQLASFERERAARFASRKLRARYLASRMALRRVLASALHIDAADVNFQIGSNGKPFLDPRFHPEKIAFNLSHCEDFAIIALSRDREIGVDVEDMSRDMEYVDIARLMFSESERKTLEALPEQERPGYFFRCWTAREAILKCIGMGLSENSRVFSVMQGHALAAQISEATADCWSLREIPLPSPMVGTVAMQGRLGRLTIREYSWIDRHSLATGGMHRQFEGVRSEFRNA